MHNLPACAMSAEKRCRDVGGTYVCTPQLSSSHGHDMFQDGRYDAGREAESFHTHCMSVSTECVVMSLEQKGEPGMSAVT